jgi:hypothetical protein
LTHQIGTLIETTVSVFFYMVSADECLIFPLLARHKYTPQSGRILPLALVGREPSDETVVWQYAPADSRSVASGGIGEVVAAGKSIQSQEG